MHTSCHMETCHAYGRVTSHIWIRRVTCTSCHAYWYIMSHDMRYMRVRHVAHYIPRILVPGYSSSYDSFHWKCYTPEIHQIEKLRFVGISRYKFKLRFGFHLNLYREIGVSRFGGFWESSIFNGTCHTAPKTFLENSGCRTRNPLAARTWGMFAICPFSPELMVQIIPSYGTRGRKPTTNKLLVRYLMADVWEHVVSHVWIRHVTWHDIYERTIPRGEMYRAIFEWVMSHVWASHVTFLYRLVERLTGCLVVQVWE